MKRYQDAPKEVHLLIIVAGLRDGGLCQNHDLLPAPPIGGPEW
jgi:hypothetical protein